MTVPGFQLRVLRYRTWASHTPSSKDKPNPKSKKPLNPEISNNIPKLLKTHLIVVSVVVGARLVTSSSPSSTCMHHSNKTPQLQSKNQTKHTHTHNNTNTTQNQPKTREIKLEQSKLQNAKKQCHKKRDLSEAHPKPGQNSRKNSVPQDNSC